MRQATAKRQATSVWDLSVGRHDLPSAGRAKGRKALLDWWGQSPLNFILGEDDEEREIVSGSGIYSKKLIWTSDEKDDNAPLKPFPEWEYVQRYITVLHEEDEVLSDKARQMFMTTSTLAYIMWNCMFRLHRRWIWTKTTEEESIAHLDFKIRKVHERLPRWVREALPIDGPMGRVDFPKTSSSIIAGTENVAMRAARGGTATGFGLDEGAFMDQFQQAWAAAAPMAKKLIGLTTPNIGTRGALAYYQMLERDAPRYEDGVKPKPVVTSDLPPLQGFNVRRTSAGYAVVEVDLEADPQKRDPAFIEALHRRQPNEREFRREYLRDWTVAAGETFYPEWGANGGNNLYVKPIAHLLDGPIFRCWDFGYRSPAVCLFQMDPRKERVWVIRELRAKNIDIWAFADLVMYACGEVDLPELGEETDFQVRKWIDKIAVTPNVPALPWFDSREVRPEFVDLAGPEATFVDSKYQQSKASTDEEVLRDRGIFLSVTGAQWNARENAIRKLLRMKEDGWPGLIIDPSCPELIEAFNGALCYALPSPQNPLPDAPAKNGIHDHLHDALSYGIVQVIEMDEKMRDGRHYGRKSLPQLPAQALFHEGLNRASNAQTEAQRPRMGRQYR